MKTFRWIIVISSVVLTAALSLAVTAPGKKITETKAMSQKTLNANAWTIYTTNYGPFVNPQTGNSGGSWGGVQYGYIYGAGMWVGAKDTSGTPYVAVGYNPSSGAAEYCPINPITGAYTQYNSDPLARVYSSTDPNDLADWPIKDGSGNSVIRSIQDCYAVYSDQNPVFSFSGSKPIGIRVDQLSFAWNYADNNDIVFFYFKIKNVSGDSLKGVYIGPCIDADIGYEGDGPITPNDRTIFDYTRNLAIQFQTFPEDGWPKVGVLGCRFFESPVNNTGDTVNIIDNQYPHSIAPGDTLGMTAFKIFVRAGKVGDPATDAEAYAVMEGYDFITWNKDGYDEWGSDNPGDKRFLMSSGPFNMGHNDSATTCIGIMACATGDFAKDTVQIKKVSDVAQDIYNNGFALAEAPAVPALLATPGDGYVRLSWDKISETTPDSYALTLSPIPMWYYYFPGTWKHLKDQNRVDSFRIKTGDFTWATIPPGAANPSGGTDTLEAYYSQKEMYEAYDFQGYAAYRANTQADLNDPAKRTLLGTLHFGSSGARSCFFDKADGIQIVLDIKTFAYQTPDTTYYLPIYDTLGTDCGLAYTLADYDVINGTGYYYGLSAYDYQPNVYFTRKCPTTIASSPSYNAQYAVPKEDLPGYIPPNITIRVDGGSDSRYGGALDYFENLQVANPKIVPDDSFKLCWNEMNKRIESIYNYPIYRGYLFNSSDVLIDSITLQTNYAQYPTSNYYGTPYDEMPFGGIVFKPYLDWSKRDAIVDSLHVVETPGGVRTYPKDSIFTLVDTINTFRVDRAQWQWRGSDIEIRWRDSVGAVGTNPSGNILTCTVWDITNNVEVPWEGGLSKANMTKSAWCFNPLSASSGTTKYIDSTMVAGIGMHIAGVTMYFKRFGGVGTASRMSWPNRPETGDIWRVFCSGPTTPSNGALATFIMTPEVSGVAGRPGIDALNVFLSQNAPNPFGHSGTNISYQVGGNGSVSVSLKIYNITGQLVKTLVNDNKTPGRYNAVWNGQSDKGQKVSAGIYIYRLQAGEKNITKKMVLIK